MIELTPASIALLQKMSNLNAKTALLKGMLGAVDLAADQSKKITPVDSDRLRSSIGFAADWEGDTLVGAWGTNVAPHYGPDVEYGTKPHWPPVGALTVWAARHGFAYTPRGRRLGARGGGPSADTIRKNADFLVRRAIARHGTKARPFLRPVLESSFMRAVFNTRMMQAIQNYFDAL